MQALHGQRQMLALDLSGNPGIKCEVRRVGGVGRDEYGGECHVSRRCGRTGPSLWSSSLSPTLNRHMVIASGPVCWWVSGRAPVGSGLHGGSLPTTAGAGARQGIIIWHRERDINIPSMLYMAHRDTSPSPYLDECRVEAWHMQTSAWMEVCKGLARCCVISSLFGTDTQTHEVWWSCVRMARSMLISFVIVGSIQHHHHHIHNGEISTHFGSSFVSLSGVQGQQWPGGAGGGLGGRRGGLWTHADQARYG